jgi:hypothetical protein
MSSVRAISTLSFVLIATACATQPIGTSVGVPQSAMEKRTEEALRGNNDPFTYAMRGPDESVIEARSKINAWIRYNMQRAFEYKSRGDTEAAQFHFFMARYTLRNVALPAANDEKGDPAVFRGQRPANPGEPAGRYWRDKIDEDMQFMFNNNLVPRGDLLRMYGIDTATGPVDRPNQLARPSFSR